MKTFIVFDTRHEPIKPALVIQELGDAPTGWCAGE